jgi:hypothetical protein
MAKPQTTKKAVKSGKERRRQKADTGSACDLSRETDEDEEQPEVVTSTSSQVSDFTCIVTYMGVDSHEG